MAEPAARIMPADSFGEPDLPTPRQNKRIKARAATIAGVDIEREPGDAESDDIEKHALDTTA